MDKLTQLLQQQFDKMCATGKLFRVALTGAQIWNLYLEGFPSGKDPVFRDPQSSVHNCNNCNNFIRRYGNIVAIDKNYNIMTIFDVDTDDEEYKDTISNMSKLIKKSSVVDIFVETFNELNSLPYESCNKSQPVYQLGIASNYKKYTEEEAAAFGVVNTTDIYTFHHFNLKLPTQFVDKSGTSRESISADYKSNKQVFQRAMVELPLDTLELVEDLIKQGSLLDGETHLKKLQSIITMKKAYEKVAVSKRDNWCWIQSYEYVYAKFKNELLGVLCTELAEGKELNEACKAWNKRVDPANYMKAVAPITEAQKKRAQQFVEENGYMESFDRRIAVLDDIKVTEIKHINTSKEGVKAVSVFDSVKPVKASRHKRNEFDNVEEVSIDKFMKDILPSCTAVSLYLENRMEGNLVTMTTAKKEDCKLPFKWDNPYSWTYKGNLAGKSMIKEAVKSQGGNVNGILRFSIMWSEGSSQDNSDLDAHCIEPNSNTIYFGNKTSSSSGFLDIDITQPLNHKGSGREVVENIAFTNLSRMREGTYVFLVNQFASRGSTGFKAEIEFDGEIYQYEYNQPVRGNVTVAKVTLKDGKFSIKHSLESSSSSKEMYSLESQNFHKVGLICLSPNHWGTNEVGNKHYFFMLEGARADGPVRSFHNENLNNELVEHRKVLDILGNVTMVSEPVKNQLSGVGFNATVRDEVILKLEGNFKRVIKVKF